MNTEVEYPCSRMRSVSKCQECWAFSSLGNRIDHILTRQSYLDIQACEFWSQLGDSERYRRAVEKGIQLRKKQSFPLLLGRLLHLLSFTFLNCNSSIQSGKEVSHRMVCWLFINMTRYLVATRAQAKK